MDFEWNTQKAKVNLLKHGVSFEEASTVLADPLSWTIDDPVHSADEDRYIVLGESAAGRLLMVNITDRGQRVRIISARLMTPREKRIYEQIR
jgi:uncharacterized DUF497 family protein